MLDFVDYRLDVDKPNYSIEECKERDATYAAALRVTARLLNKESGEIKESEVFMGDFPLMTESGTFIINGAERVVVLSWCVLRVSITKWITIRLARSFSAPPSFLIAVPGWNMRTMQTMFFMSASIRTERSL